jgi:hypothetical protein
MSRPIDRETQQVEYLLGRAPQDVCSELEERLFTDDDFHEELRATADDLISAYLSGSLTETDRNQFENHFLSSPAHRERLAFMKALLSAVNRAPVQAPALATWGWAAAAALVGIAILVASVLPKPPGPREATASPTLATIVVMKSVPTSPEPKPLPPPGLSEVTVRMPPVPGVQATVRLAEATRVVHVAVKVNQESPSFDAVVRTASGREVWRKEDLMPSGGGTLTFDLPARLLSSDRYTLRITGEALRDAGTKPRVLEYPLLVTHGR